MDIVQQIKENSLLSDAHIAIGNGPSKMAQKLGSMEASGNVNFDARLERVPQRCNQVDDAQNAYPSLGIGSLPFQTGFLPPGLPAVWRGGSFSDLHLDPNQTFHEPCMPSASSLSLSNAPMFEQEAAKMFEGFSESNSTTSSDSSFRGSFGEGAEGIEPLTPDSETFASPAVSSHDENEAVVPNAVQTQGHHPNPEVTKVSLPPLWPQVGEEIQGGSGSGSDGFKYLSKFEDGPPFYGISQTLPAHPPLPQTLFPGVQPPAHALPAHHAGFRWGHHAQYPNGSQRPVGVPESVLYGPYQPPAGYLAPHPSFLPFPVPVQSHLLPSSRNPHNGSFSNPSLASQGPSCLNVSPHQAQVQLGAPPVARLNARPPKSETLVADLTAKLLNRDCEWTHDRQAQDQFLMAAKQAGLSYKEIRKKGQFTEAESTLRGRYRTLTKRKEDRVRKPRWTKQDVDLLYEAVHSLVNTKPSSSSMAGKAFRNLSESEKFCARVPWKKVSQYIVEHGGTYAFANAACKKKWDEISSTSHG